MLLRARRLADDFKTVDRGPERGALLRDVHATRAEQCSALRELADRAAVNFTTVRREWRSIAAHRPARNRKELRPEAMHLRLTR